MCLYYLCANCIQFSDNCLFNSDTNFSFFVIKNVENNASAMQESKFGDKDFIKEWYISCGLPWCPCLSIVERGVLIIKYMDRS